MQRILKEGKSFEHTNAVGNQSQLYYIKHRNSPEVCLKTVSEEHHVSDHKMPPPFSIPMQCQARNMQAVCFIPTENKLKS